MKVPQELKDAYQENKNACDVIIWGGVGAIAGVVCNLMGEHNVVTADSVINAAKTVGAGAAGLKLLHVAAKTGAADEVVDTVGAFLRNAATVVKAVKAKVKKLFKKNTPPRKKEFVWRGCPHPDASKEETPSSFVWKGGSNSNLGL